MQQAARARRALVSMMAVLAVLAGASGLVVLVAAPVATAAPIIPFAPIFSTNDNGSIALFGNTLMTCPASAPTCAAALNGTAAPATNNNNNAYGMVLLDVDSDATTLSSSTSDVVFPDGASVLWAGLYWGARTTRGTGGSPAVGNPSTLRFATPAGGGYQTVTATRTFDGGQDGAYQRGAVVTGLVAAAGPGTYAAANIAAPTGEDRYAGWTLVVVFRDPAAPLRNLSVFDGFASVQRGENVSVPVSGFIAPLAGTVQTRAAFVAYEGDRGSDGDRALINTTLLATTESPGTNFFNGSNERDGANITTRNPASRNMLGYDLIDLGVPGAVPNGARSFTVNLTTGGETYFLGALGTTIDLDAPDFSTSSKTVTNLSGHEPAQPGDTLEYTITLVNSGQDPARNSVARDVLPPGTTLVPGSLSATNGAATYDAGTRTIVAPLGDGAGTPAAGGELAPAESASFTFRVTVDPGAANTTLTNSANLAYVAATIGTPFTYETNQTATPVTAVADLRLSKATALTTAAPGEPVPFTLTVTNAGPNPADGVIIVDTLPAGTSFAGADAGCLLAGGAVRCDVGTLAAGAVATRTVRLAAPSSSTAVSIANSATVTSSTVDPTPGNNSASAGVALQPRADLSVTKTAGPAVVPGTPGTFTIVATNNGPSDARQVRLTDTVTGRATVAAVSTDPPLAPPDGCTTAEDSFSCTIAVLPAGAQVTATLTVLVPPDATAPVLNGASVSSRTPDADVGNNTATNVPLPLAPAAAALRLTKAAEPQVIAGTSTTFTIQVANDGPSTARTVTVDDPATPGLTPTAATSSLGSCTLTSGAVSCAVGDLAPGASATITVTAAVAPDVLGTLTNTATAGSPTSPAPATATATTTAVDQADVAMAKTGSPNPPAGGTQIYTVTIVNAGPSVARNATITDQLPPGEVVISTTPTVGSPVCTTDQGAGVVTCVAGTLAVGAIAQVQITVQLPTPAPPGPITNTATAFSSAPDPVPAGNTATFTYGLTQVADLAIGKNLLTDPVVAGAPVTYQLIVLNQGPSPSDAVVTDTAPPGVTWQAPADPRCTVAGDTVTCDLPDLAPGTAVFIELTGDVAATTAAGSQVANTATVAVGPGSAAIDSTSGNNTASAGAAVTTRADVTVSKAFDVASGPEGTATTFTVTVNNAGPSVARDVRFRDVFPIEASALTALPAGCEPEGPDVVCALGDLAPGVSRSLDFGLTVVDNPEDTYVNTVTASSATPDPTPPVATAAFVVTSPVARLVAFKQPCDVVTLSCTPLPVPLVAGGPFLYALVVDVLGVADPFVPPAPSSADDVVLTDLLPVGLGVVSVTPSQGTCTIAPDTADPSRDRVTCNLGRIDNRALIEQRDPYVIVAGTVSPTLATPVTNTVRVDSPDDPDPTDAFQSSSVTSPVSREADLTLSKEADSATAVAGGTVGYSIVVSNAGPSAAADVVVTDTLPPGLTLEPAETDPACAPLPPPGGALTCAVGDVAPGTTRVVRVVGRLDETAAVGVITNVASLTSATPDPTPPAPASVTTPVARDADLVVTKSADVDRPIAGQSLTYTVTVTNEGPSTAVATVLSDAVPAGLTLVSSSSPTGACSDDGTTVSCAFGTLAAGDAGTMEITLAVPADLPPTTIVNAATAGSATPDGDPSDNSASVAVDTAANADVRAAKRIVTDPMVAGAPVTFEISVTNDGPSVAAGAEAFDAVPPGLAFVSASDGCAAQNQDLEGGTVVVCSLGDIPVGATVTATITMATPPDGVGTVENTVIGSSTYFDPDGADNVATVTGPLTALADLAITKEGPPALVPGSTAEYRLQWRNDGPSTATGVVVTDTVPPGLTVTAAPGCTVTGAAVSCPLGTVAPGASGTIAVTVAVSPTLAGDPLGNTAGIAGDQVDPDPSDSTATVTTPIVAAFPNSRFVALRPERILDTRTQNSQVGYSGPKPGPGTIVDLQITGRGGVPTDGVTAVVFNLTATEADGPGFITAFPTGSAMPLAASVNVDVGTATDAEGQTLPNLVTVPVGEGGRISLYTQPGSHLLADVAGYYQAVSASASGRFTAIEPARLLDTRPVSGPVAYSGDKPAAGQTVTFPVAGRGGVPASGVSAVVLTVTITEATDRGFVTAHPADGALPWSSNLNAEYAGETIANQVIVPLGPGGDVSLYTQSGGHLLADVAGWFTNEDGARGTAGLFVPVTPNRQLDTRLTGAKPGPGATVDVPIVLPPAADAAAIVGNLTATEATAPGFVTVHPDAVLPWASNLNLEREGQTLSDHVTVRLGGDGAIRLTTQSGTHLITDVVGWYRRT